MVIIRETGFGLDVTIVDNLDKKSITDTANYMRISGIKKCRCPFLLKCEQQMCGIHNHLATKYIEGHSFIRKPS